MELGLYIFDYYFIRKIFYFYRHGIGHYLSVHEGPERIATSYSQYEEPLADGMFLSVEPGFYKAGDFGIRIENDMEVIMGNKSIYDDTQFLSFNTITLIPYERSLIDISLLTLAQHNAIDEYHARIAQILEPLLVDDKAALNALHSRTAKLNPNPSPPPPFSTGFINLSSPFLMIFIFILKHTYPII